MNPPAPKAEVAITAELVRCLLATQHPDLADRPLTYLAEGWDNVMYRLGADLIIRLPRREMSVGLIAHEARWLPELAPRLEVPISAAVRTGQPSEQFGWPWLIVPWIPGVTLEQSELDGAEPAESVAVALGAALAALHHPAPDVAPHNPYRGIPLAERHPVTSHRLGQLRSREPELGATATAIWQEGMDAPAWDGPPLWIHGDLHPRNLLVHNQQLAGIIDWGDISAGDPAYDLGVAWLAIPAQHRDAFWRAADCAARPVSEVLRRRSRACAVAWCAAVGGSAQSDWANRLMSLTVA